MCVRKREEERGGKAERKREREKGSGFVCEGGIDKSRLVVVREAGWQITWVLVVELLLVPQLIQCVLNACKCAPNEISYQCCAYHC